jgi:hypothetical protein
MDNDIFEQFTEQLRRYIRERLIPAEKEVLETEMIPEAIMAENARPWVVRVDGSGRIWRRWYEYSAIYPHYA